MIKRLALSVVGTPVIGRLLASLRRNRCAIVMLHRFAGTEGVPHGHDPAFLRSVLANLRASGVRLIDLDDALESYALGLSRRRGLPPAVVFTVDDGYRDFATAGVPAFAEFDCPATCFVVPGVIEGRSWFWWDQIDWLLHRLQGRAFTIEVGPDAWQVEQTTPTRTPEWQGALCERMKAVTPAARVSVVEQLEHLVGEPCPRRAPSMYDVLSWDELRALERRGMRFGAHTMSHPVLSQCTPDEAQTEIFDSVARVRSELANPSQVFAYPYGKSEHFTPREGLLLQRADMRWAVTAEPGLVRSGLAEELGQDWNWRVPRFSFESRPGVLSRHLFL